MEEVNLTPSSYIVLGMVSAFGPATSYDIHGWAEGSIGYFWPFSRAQLYAEPKRLADAGLLSESQEQEGRRRRSYAMTKAGEAELTAWLKEPTQTPTEIRDLGLLKLYFSQLSTKENLVQLATQQAQVHQRRLEVYEQLQTELADDDRAPFALVTLEMGARFERMAVTFWQEVATDPPS